MSKDQFHYEPTLGWLMVFAVLGLMSMIFSTIIPTMYYLYPKTRQHPAILLVLLCLAEFIEVYHLILMVVQFKGYISYLHLESLPPKLIFFGLNLRPDVMCRMNFAVFFACVFFQQALYITWSIDLILTLKKPFLSTKKRLFVYIPFAFLAMTSQVLMNETKILNACSSADQLLIQLNIEDLDAVAYQDVFYVVSVITIIVAIQAIRSAKKKPNAANAIKVRFLRQQVVSHFTIIFIWTTPTLALLYSRSSVFLDLGFMLVCSQGIILGLLRLQEPFFRKQLLLSFQNLLGIQQEQSVATSVATQQMSSEAWNVPLASLIGMIQHQDVLASILDGILQSLKQNHGSHPFLEFKMDYSEERSLDSKISNNGSVVENKETQVETDQNKSFALKVQFIHKSIDMRVVEYAPTVFEYLRMLDGIDLKIVEASLSVNKNLAGIQQLTESLGRSGSFFFFSHDRRFILKTIGESEQRFLIKILSAYTDFIRKNPKSLLARIYGCFTVRIDSVAPINLLFMENTFHRIPEPDMVFDLKGSLLGRKTHNPNFGKDLDLLESENVLINMNHIWRTQIIEQIKCDSEFLQSLNIMDYSLLLGIQRTLAPLELKKNYSSARKVEKLVADNIYESLSLGIIDYLQEFDISKFVENRYKSLFSPEKIISSVSPEQYCHRFVLFLNTILCSIHEY